MDMEVNKQRRGETGETRQLPRRNRNYDNDDDNYDNDDDDGAVDGATADDDPAAVDDARNTTDGICPDDRRQPLCHCRGDANGPIPRWRTG